MNKRKILSICIAVLFLTAILAGVNSLAITLKKKPVQQTNCTDTKMLSTKYTLFTSCDIEGTLEDTIIGGFVSILDFQYVTVSNSQGTYSGTDVLLLAIGLKNIVDIKKTGYFSAEAFIGVILRGDRNNNDNIAPGAPMMTWRDSNGDYTLSKGETGYFYFASGDPDGDQVKFKISWTGFIEDGHDYTGFVDSGATASKFHTYYQPGTYDLTVTAIDANGAESAPKVYQITVFS